MYLQKFFLKTKEKSKNRISSNAEKKNIDESNEASTHAYIYIIISQSGSPDRSVDQNPNPPT